MTTPAPDRTRYGDSPNLAAHEAEGIALDRLHGADDVARDPQGAIVYALLAVASRIEALTEEVRSLPHADDDR